MQFNERLKKLRQEKGVTQKELADAVYVSRSAVAKWENGLGLPNEESLQLLAKFFGVEEQMLMSDSEVETVIVGKNNIMARQKQLIFGLLAIFIVILIVTISIFVATGRNGSQEEPQISPVVSRELIFETERNMDVSSFPVYTEPMSPSDDFAPSRTFEVKWNQTSAEIPKIFIREQRANGAITYKSDIFAEDMEKFSIKFVSSRKDMTFDAQCSPENTYINLQVNVFDDAPEYEKCFNITYEDLTMSVKVFKNTLAYESVEITPQGRLFEVGPSAVQYFSIKASEAYGYDRDWSAFVEKIEFPDNSVKENAGGYAWVALNQYDPHSMYNLRLYTTTRIPIGSKIMVGVSFDNNRIKKTVVFEVVRVPVESVTVFLGGYPNWSSGLEIGKEYKFEISAQPEDATFNVLKEDFDLIMCSYPEIAGIRRTEDGWFVSIDDRSEFADMPLALTVTLPEGKCVTGEWYTKGVPIKNVEIVRGETGEELGTTLYVHRGDEIPIRAAIQPENATYMRTEFVHDTNDDKQCFTLSEDGNLTIAGDAPFGTKIDIKFRIFSFKKALLYQLYITVFVEEAPVERVELDSETYFVKRAAKGGKPYYKEYDLIARHFPENLPVYEQKFEILDNVGGVWIGATTGRLFVGYDAPNYAQIRVKVTVNGVESNILTFVIIPPGKAESFTIDIGTDKIEREKPYQIFFSPYPYDTDLEPVHIFIEVLKGDLNHITIINNKFLLVASTAEIGTVIRVQAITTNGLESNILELTII